MLTQAERDENERWRNSLCPPLIEKPDTRRLMAEDSAAELAGDRVRQEVRDGERDLTGRRIQEQNRR